jgi:hypothetical protein
MMSEPTGGPPAYEAIPVAVDLDCQWTLDEGDVWCGFAELTVASLALALEKIH